LLRALPQMTVLLIDIGTVYREVKSKNINSKDCGRKWQCHTEAAARVVIVRSTATGARVGSTADVCVRQGSRSMVPPPF